MKGDHPTDRQSGICDFDAQRGSITSGRLVFTLKAAGVTILADPSIPDLARGRFAHHLDPSIPDLARGRFAHHLPRVQVKEGEITFLCRNFSPFKRLFPSQVPLEEIRLNPSISWEIEFRGGISNLYADLRGLELRSIDLLGGASQIVLLLSKPAKTTFIYITGGIRDSTIRLPPSVGVSVQVSGGVDNLVFDKQRFAAVREEIKLENSKLKSGSSRCEICVAGGASNATIELL